MTEPTPNFTTLFDAQPTYEQLAAAFDAIEADITYIDDADIVRYYSPFRIFERPPSCLNANVYDCHPPRTHAEVRDMLDAFRAQAKDTVSQEITLPDDHPGDQADVGRTVRICYHAIRDRAGTYLGCLEVATFRD